MSDQLPHLQHKDGCIVDQIHRVPIDCVTVNALWDIVRELRNKNKLLIEESMKLKARIYDLEHDDE